MKKSCLLPKSLVLFFLMLSLFSTHAQQSQKQMEKAAREYMQEAEEAMAENDVARAEAMYRKAIATNPADGEARYNLGNLYYNKELTSEAVERHGQVPEITDDKLLKHNAFHNRGNALMKQKKYKEAIEAYKNSLRNDPEDDQTRYNLALAKKMLEEEQKNGGGGQNKNENKDQKDQNKDQENKDQQGDQGEKKEDQQGKPDENKEGDQQNKNKGDQKDQQGEPQNNQNKEGNKEDERQQPQPKPGQLSPQQVKNLLEAMGNEEKKVQEKMNARKVKGSPVKTEKDW